MSFSSLIGHLGCCLLKADAVSSIYTSGTLFFEVIVRTRTITAAIKTMAPIIVIAMYLKSNVEVELLSPATATSVGRGLRTGFIVGGRVELGKFPV